MCQYNRRSSAYITNLSIKTSTVPSVWKIAKITPVFKSGDSTKPENLRSISILPIGSEILKKAVHHDLLKFLEKKNLLTYCQYGFRSKRSTKLATTLFYDTIHKDINNGKLVWYVYIDLSKAFDTISHSVLIEKLQTYGVEGDELVWLIDYLFERSQIAAMNNIKPNKEPIYCGFPQGSILGSLLFIVFYNDFADHLEYCDVITYVDDTLIFIPDKNVSNIETKLNMDLQKISA